ncbi:hypothetical protein CKALI_03485 [Corynebacterium kalinowskii]|uniref:Secreted protein n=1 Tax=Corynebacterium kalinowskii TaxID=2675216 RepID=A0A6B8VW89_9CORY|nr:hypothetical protein [Corynebacterium kalinowskii]QGU01580.1 hypothetical protein CKALI_03485 [Corynebacterium kalinowskii]
MKLHAPAIALVVALSLTVSGCAAVGEKINGKPASASGDGEKVEVTKTPEPQFQPKQVEPIVAKDPTEPVKDEGLGVQWRIMSVKQGTTGGAQFLIEMKNLNEEFAVPQSAVGEPTLTLKSGGPVNLMQVEDQGLDAPLGALATTIVSYTFNTSPWNLSNAELKIGNAVFKGYLNL